MARVNRKVERKVMLDRVLCRYNEIESHPRAELHMFSKQRYSQLQDYGRRNLVSETPSHAYTHTHTNTLADLEK